MPTEPSEKTQEANVDANDDEATPDPRDTKIAELEKAAEADSARYKGLQRELGKANTRPGPDAGVSAQIAGLTETVNELTTVVAEVAEKPELVAKAKTSQATAAAQRRAADEAREYAEDMADLAESAGYDDYNEFWNAPEMATARTSWDKGDFARAFSRAGIATGKLQRKASTEAETKPPEEEKKVTTEETKSTPNLATPGSTGAGTESAVQLLAKDMRKMSPSELATHQVALKKLLTS